MLVYVCIAVISQFVFFGFHLENGKIPLLKVGFSSNVTDMEKITAGKGKL
jgi:hypothetical protein